MTKLSTTARIRSDCALFTLINTFRVAPDKQSALAGELAAITESRMRFLPGFIAASVHSSLDGSHVVNYVQWETVEHFRTMFDDEVARAHMSRVMAMAEAVMPVSYKVSYVGATAE